MSEYWIKEDGSVDFADGDIGDYNHEGIVIDSIQREIVDKCEQIFDIKKSSHYGPRNFSDDEHIDWDEFKNSLAKSYADKYPDQRIIKAFNNNPELLVIKAMKEANIKKVQYEVAEGTADARNYAMRYWGWKTYRNGNIDSWFFRRSDLNAIIEGIEEIAYDEGWSKKLPRKTFTINIFSTGKNFTLSYNQMKNPKMAHQQQSPQFDYLTTQASKQVRDIEYKNLHPFYQGRGGSWQGGGTVNPFGDSVLSFKTFLEDNK